MQLSRFPFDLTLARFLQSTNPEALEPILHLLNTSNDELQILLPVFILSAGLWSGHHFFATLFWFPFVASAANFVLKEAIQRPRPSASHVAVTDAAAHFSFPSAHVMTSVVLFGFLFLLLNEVVQNRPVRRAAQGLCALIIALMGFARIYVGAHWPSDVVAGYVFGALILLPLVHAYLKFGRNRALAQ